MPTNRDQTRTRTKLRGHRKTAAIIAIEIVSHMAPNRNHPLMGLTHSERRRLRERDVARVLAAIAQKVAHEAKRTATEPHKGVRK